MKLRQTYFIVALVLLSLPGCGVKNWFVTRNGIGTEVSTDLPDEFMQETVDSRAQEQQDALVFLEDTPLLQDSTIAIDSVQATPLADSLLTYAK